jgi:hypothetical protein
LGLLINVSGQYSDKMGYTSETINVINITNTLISPEQIYDGHEYFWQKYNKLDNGINQDNLLSGSAIGKGNSLIPIYINKYHWHFAKEYLEENISIALTQNPYLFKPIMIDLYSHVLLKLISYILTIDCSDKNIKILIGFIKTMIFLNLDKVKYFYDDLSQVHNLKSIISSFLINYICGKIKISNEDYNLYFLKIYEEITRRNMRKKYKTKKELCENVNIKIFNNIINFLNESINQENIYELQHIWSFAQLFKQEYINNLLSKYEEFYGWLEDNDIIEFKNIIKSNNVIFNFKEITAYGESYNDMIQYFTLQTFITRTPKLKNKFKITNNLIDVFNHNFINICKENYNILVDLIIN